MIRQTWWKLVRFGFHLLYNELAFTYDLVSKAVSMGQWRCWQRAALTYLPPTDGARLLELAHGTGDLQLDLAAAGYRARIGYDLSPAMGEITRRKLDKHGVEARLVRGMAQRLPFADESFHAVVSTFPTDFIFAESTLRETWRVLRPGGRLVIVINGVMTGRGLMTRLLEGLYWITGQRTPPVPDVIVNNRTSPQAEAQQIIRDRVITIFTDSGFQIEFRQELCPGSYALLIVAEKVIGLQTDFTNS